MNGYALAFLGGVAFAFLVSTLFVLGLCAWEARGSLGRRPFVDRSKW